MLIAPKRRMKVNQLGPPEVSDASQDDCIWEVRFLPDGSGLRPVFLPPDSYRRSPAPGEHCRHFSIDVNASEDHGLITIPIRLPRYLMPQWSKEDWAKFVEGEIGFFQSFIDEGAAQCLSLAMVQDRDRKKCIIKDAEQVVIDFRGDLPACYLPTMLGGYKIGVYRTGNQWPIWMSIQPTYDLALEEAAKLRDEAKIPSTGPAIVAVGRLARFFRVAIGDAIVSDRNLARLIRPMMGLWLSVGAVIGFAICRLFR